jgi:hypothetical protein
MTKKQHVDSDSGHITRNIDTKHISEGKNIDTKLPQNMIFIHTEQQIHSQQT